MKLFQQMLVAGAALSLITPLAAQASDINLDGMDSYSRSTKKAKRFNSKSFVNEVNEKIANINESKVQQKSFEAGSFSETTSMGGSAVFVIGGIENANDVHASARQTTQAMYQFTLDLNTSFTGDDNLYTRLRTGNGKNTGGAFYDKTAFYHADTYSSAADVLAVDKIWYEFPLGDSEKFTGFVGPKIENYYMYAAPVSIYRPGFHKAFKLGSLSGAFGASTASGVGVKYVGDSGFAWSSNIVSKGAEGSGGFLTDEDESKWDTMLAYTKDQFHVSLTLSQQHDDWESFEYYSTDAAHDIDNDTNGTAYALRGYWRPEESGTLVPEISLGYDTINFDGQSSNKVKEASSYFVGLGWPDVFQDSDYIGIGFGQPLKVSETANGAASPDDSIDPFLWEVSYSFKVNDSMTIVPTIFGGQDIVSYTDEDYAGAAVTTKFKF